MLSCMPINEARRKLVRQHTRQQEEDARSKGGLPQTKLIVKGRAQQSSVYTIDIRELVFNKANGRIKAEVCEKESELGRDLDIFEEADQATIREILLSIRADENEKIKEDLRRNGQLTPGIITCDGIVINGNRRKAILEELWGKEKEDRFRYLEVQILPSDITKAELWLIEAGIQMSAPQQLDYSPINHLLKLREGVTAGLEIDDMASRIYGVTRDKIEADLQRLELIDEYLCDFLRKRERYYLAKNVNEHFIDLQKILAWAKHPRGRVRTDWQWDEDDINELKLVAFYYIRMRMSHWGIRGLRDLFATKKAWLRLKQTLHVKSDLTNQDRCDLGLADTADIEDDDGDESALDTQSPITPVEEQDLREEQHWKKAREAKLKAFYEDAKEQEQVIKDSERPLSLARRALRNIEAIPLSARDLQEADIDDVFRKIIEATNALRKVVKKGRDAQAVSPSRVSKRTRHR